MIGTKNTIAATKSSLDGQTCETKFVTSKVFAPSTREVTTDHFRSRDNQGKRVNPPLGLLTKVIPLKLFLDMVLSASEDATRAMSG